MGRRNSSRHGGRDAHRIPSGTLPRLESLLRPLDVPSAIYPARDFLSDLAALEDRRTWYPGETLTPFDWSPPRTEIGSVGRLEYPRATSPLPARQSRFLSPSVAFQAHPQVNICTRRKTRREVLHAIKVAGRRGVGRGRRQVRNQFSEVSC